MWGMVRSLAETDGGPSVRPQHGPGRACRSRRRSVLQHQMSAPRRPAHLLLSIHSPMQQPLHRALGDRRRDQELCTEAEHEPVDSLVHEILVGSSAAAYCYSITNRTETRSGGEVSGFSDKNDHKSRWTNLFKRFSDSVDIIRIQRPLSSSASDGAVWTVDLARLENDVAEWLIQTRS
jgi:hypothetical protein